MGHLGLTKLQLFEIFLFQSPWEVYNALTDGGTIPQILESNLFHTGKTCKIEQKSSQVRSSRSKKNKQINILQMASTRSSSICAGRKLRSHLSQFQPGILQK